MLVQDEKEVEWYKVVVLYSVDVNLFPLFLQVVVDWLRNVHKFRDEVKFDDYFKIDYENNKIMDVSSGVEIDLDEVDIEDENLKRRIGKKYRMYKKIVERYSGVKLKDVYEKINFNFNTWAKFGFLRVEYSLLRGKLAFIFFTQHRGIVDRIKANKRKSFFIPNMSFFVKRSSEEDLVKELKEEILKEVVDIVVV